MRLAISFEHKIRTCGNMLWDQSPSAIPHVRCIEMRPNLKQRFIPGALNLFSRELWAANQITAMLDCIVMESPKASSNVS